jgi:hypothetical protein
MYIGVNDIRLREIHRGEPLVPQPRACDFEIAIEKIKRL